MKPKQKGFTLIELLVVIAIIGILVTIAIVAIDPIKIINNAKDGRARTDLNQVKASMQLYYNENTRYPTTGEVATSGCTSSGSTICFFPTYMKSLPSEISISNYLPTPANCDNTTLCTDYTAHVVLNYPNSDDNNTKTKCNYGAAGDKFYVVCPD